MEHVVSVPHAPFQAADGAFEVHQIPAWKDNLIWLLVCRATHEAAVVDGPDAGGVLAYCEAHGIRLTTILNTHTHPDHVGINRELSRLGLLEGMRVFGPKKAAAGVPGLTDAVSEGDRVGFGKVQGDVWLTEGHLDGHISFVFRDVVFCGDTLFGGGCGYLFDGPPSTMHASLQRLATLPPETRVCCAHEYTEDNLLFAWTVEPDNHALLERCRAVLELRGKGESTVPSTIGIERDTNPFIRVHSPAVRRAAGEPTSDAEVFAAIRALKDAKHYRGEAEAWMQRLRSAP